jgi:hypothetical protein
MSKAAFKKEQLLSKFKYNCENCVKYSKWCDYGCEDEMNTLFGEYYPGK